MSYLIVFKINNQGGRDLSCTDQIHREERTSKSFGSPLMYKAEVSELGWVHHEIETISHWSVRKKY